MGCSFALRAQIPTGHGPEPQLEWRVPQVCPPVCSGIHILARVVNDGPRQLVWTMSSDHVSEWESVHAPAMALVCRPQIVRLRFNDSKVPSTRLCCPPDFAFGATQTDCSSVEAAFNKNDSHNPTSPARPSGTNTQGPPALPRFPPLAPNWHPTRVSLVLHCLS